MPCVKSFHPDFSRITGIDPLITLLVDNKAVQDFHGCGDLELPNFHEACIYDAASKSIFVTSNQLSNTILPAQNKDGAAATGVKKHVKLWRIYDRPHGSSTVAQITFPGWEGALLNGGVNFGVEEILLCAQGSKNPRDLQGLIAMKIPKVGEDNLPTSVRPVLSSFHGTPFNSVNDVIVHPHDNTILFTDPCYGYHQEVRPPPQLPNQVYHFDPRGNSIRAIANGFTRPNGLCFSPDLQTLYVTDTGAIHGSAQVPIDPAGPSHIYAFDVHHPAGPTRPFFLTNRRLFAYAPGRFPDGIKCDTAGNVYSGCGDGIEVWNPHGTLLGTIAIEGGVANFCFGEAGALYACNETKVWKVELRGVDGVKGTLLGI